LLDEKTPTVTVGTADGLPCCADAWWPSADSQSPVVIFLLLKRFNLHFSLEKQREGKIQKKMMVLLRLIKIQNM
jgi:hypothetical protein